MTLAASATAPASPPAGTRRLAILLIGGALLSKILGLVREILIARAIGASVIADSFRGAQTAVLLPIALLQNETVPAVLIPAYREWNEQGVAPRRFAALSLALVLTASVIFLLVEAAAPLWIHMLLGGFGEHARKMTIAFTRVMALAMPASALLCCLSAAEIARGQSRIASLRATLLNVAVIIGVPILLLTGRPIALAWAFSIAFNGVAGWGLWMLIREGAIDPTLPSPRAVWDALVIYFRRLRPLMLQPVAEHAQIWIERLLASALAVGTLASLDYARTLTDSAVLLISQPLGLAVLSAGPSRNQRAQVDALARPVLALAIPGSIFLFCFAPEIVTLVFHRGAFNAAAIESTSEPLRGIATGLWAATLGWILVRILNSVGRNRRAAATVAAAYLANALFSALLIHRLGGFALGFGEAVRGIVLLAGVSLALGCARDVLMLLLTALPGAVALIALELTIRAEITGLVPLLLAGAAAAGLAAAFSAWLLVPRVRHHVGAALRWAR